MATTKQNIKVNVAVAGLGRMGKRHVRTMLNRVSHANVVAVCSTEPGELSWAREEYKGYGIEVYDNYGSMINHPGLQAVWVSTSTNVHASQTLEAIAKGLNVLCEKPLSTDMEEVRKHNLLSKASCYDNTQDNQLTLDQVHIGPTSYRCSQFPSPPQSHGRLLQTLRRLISKREISNRNRCNWRTLHNPLPDLRSA